MRTFFSLELPESVKNQIKSAGQSIEGPAYVKWVSEDNLHITLKFLGEVDRGRIPEIKERAEGTASRSEPFEFNIDKLGGFPNLNFPKVIWLGSSSPPDEILRLHDDLEESLFGLGFEKEDRDYVPHITLGRTKEDDESKIEQLGRNIEQLNFDSTWKVPVEHLTLMESELKSDGPVYTPLFRVDLGS
ncbi:RNA 2',3'-cyclic phosphodiesterase [Candidatus Bipolaricaulota bacterium]|nr:RNA 2',3'-cyclic phosphodiesterase [Candidatus Bipolaricaulota bacterium]